MVRRRWGEKTKRPPLLRGPPVAVVSPPDYRRACAQPWSPVGKPRKYVNANQELRRTATSIGRFGCGVFVDITLVRVGVKMRLCPPPGDFGRSVSRIAQRLSGQTPVIVKYRNDNPDDATALEAWLR